ncbi:MAG TPA: helix-turn-helix domain-containing protein [Pirellulales bacterium]|nr:helix-turn-helix domain-containing protein [Pirellulales bacterium]
MSKFVTLAEAANQLGISEDAVNDLRLSGKLYGYRDGTSWKFKPEDIEKVAQDRAGGAASDADLSGAFVMGDSQEISDAPIDLVIDPDDIDASSEEVVLLSEFELGESGPSASATIIGKPGSPLSPAESDVKLRAPADDLGEASATMIGRPGTPLRPNESAIKLESEGAEEPSASRTIIGAPGLPLGPADSAVKVQAGGPLDSPSSTIIGKPGQPPTADESVIKLSTFEDSDFDLGTLQAGPPEGSSVLPPPKAAAGGSTVFAGESIPDPVVDSGITLGDEHVDEDDFVLGGPGSDITISPGDSGISLVDPADSGLSLDAPIELRSEGGEPTFEMSESGEDLSGVTEFDSDEVMDLKTSDEFLLTPMAPEGEEASEDSGSQVIAIDSGSPFESSEGSMFAAAESGMSNMLEEDVGGGAALAEGGLGGGAAPVFAPAGAPVAAYAAETPYPVWVVILLGMCLLFLALCGMMMYDLMRNMWSWNAPYSVNSAIMDFIMGLFG